MSSTLEQIDDILDLAVSRTARCGTTRLICIDGPSGSGKTTMAHAITERTGAELVQMDDLYPGWSGLDAGASAATEIATEIAAGRTTTYVPHGWPHQPPPLPRTIAPSGLIVFEGVGSGARSVRRYACVVVWIEAPETIRKDRALARDGETFARHWDAWAAQEDAHFARERTRERADLILDGG